MAGCGGPAAFSPPPAISSVQPSNTGTPNSVVSFGNYEFVSVQGTGQIFTYNLSSGSQVLNGAPYATACADPSGMVVASIAGVNVMAADTERAAREQFLRIRRLRAISLYGRGRRGQDSEDLTDEQADQLLAAGVGAQVDQMLTYSAVALRPR